MLTKKFFALFLFQTWTTERLRLHRQTWVPTSLSFTLTLDVHVSRALGKHLVIAYFQSLFYKLILVFCDIILLCLSLSWHQSNCCSFFFILFSFFAFLFFCSLPVSQKRSDIMDKLQHLKEVMDAVSKDSTKFFEKGNKAAGTRARKNLQELKKLAQDLRVAIQDTKANMTTANPEWGMLYRIVHLSCPSVAVVSSFLLCAALRTCYLLPYMCPSACWYFALYVGLSYWLFLMCVFIFNMNASASCCVFPLLYFFFPWVCVCVCVFITQRRQRLTSGRFIGYICHLGDFE